MILKKALINLKNFSTPDFKAEFQTNLSLQIDFLDICSKHIQYAFEILDDDPMKALEIMREVNDFYDTLGAIPHEILDLSVAVVSKIGVCDMQLAISLLDEIDVDCFKIDAAIELLRRTDSTDCVNEIAKKIRVLDNERIHEFEQALKLFEIQHAKLTSPIN